MSWTLSSSSEESDSSSSGSTPVLPVLESPRPRPRGRPRGATASRALAAALSRQLLEKHAVAVEVGTHVELRCIPRTLVMQGALGL